MIKYYIALTVTWGLICAALTAALFMTDIFWKEPYTPPGFWAAMLIILVPAVPVKWLVGLAHSALIRRAINKREAGRFNPIIFILLFYVIDLVISLACAAVLVPVLVAALFIRMPVPLAFLAVPMAVPTGIMLARKLRRLTPSDVSQDSIEPSQNAAGETGDPQEEPSDENISHE